MKNLRYAIRTLARNRGFTVAALLALALGIGANTAVFSVVHAVLHRPLPYADSSRLVMVYDNFPEQGEPRGPACVADYLAWQAGNRSFQSLAAIGPNRFTITGDGEPEQLNGLEVTAAFFETLGARPVLGRAFAADEDQPGRARTAVLSDRLWRRRYSGRRDVIGKPIVLNGRQYDVIGVMPAGFQFLRRDVEVWTILTLDPPTRRGPFFLYGAARLKPGVTVKQADRDMQAIAGRVLREAGSGSQLRYPVVPLRETIVGDVRGLLLVLSGAVFLVMLIAVANVANLMLARAAARTREIAIRLSIGANRGHLVAQLMTESLVLAFAGGAAGIALAWCGLRGLRALDPRGLPRLDEIAIDTTVLAFALAASVGSALVFGLAPAIAASGTALAERLQAGGRGGAGRRQGRTRGVLVVAQVTLSVLLMIGAGLLIRSFDLLTRVNAGFTAPPDRVLAMLLSPTGARYSERAALGRYWEQLIERLRALPGVESAGVAITMPPDRVAFTDGYEIQGKPSPSGIDYPAVPVPFVSRDYFRTLGIPLVRGRWFDSRDTADSPGVTVISQTMARRYFPGENPVGQRLKHGGRDLRNPYMEIIGVVGDIPYKGLENEAGPVYYEVSTQSPARPMWVLMRTRGAARTLAPAARAAIRSLDPDVPVARVGDMSEALADAVAVPRMRSLLMGIFALAALLLAAIGIYGVISYAVTQRTQEVGIRMALGATAGSVLRLVVSQGGRLAVCGIVLGLAGAVALTRVLKGMLYGIGPMDAVTFGAAALLLGAVAVLASFIPACRAARVDPVTALRHE